MVRKSKLIFIITFTVILAAGMILKLTGVGKYTLININGAIENALGIKNMNDVTKLDNGVLVKQVKYDFWLGSRPESLASLSGKLKDSDIPFVYVQAPYEICKYDTEAALETDNSNKYADEFLKELGNLGVDFIDLREALHEEYADHYDAFFITDHHWKPSTAFWAMKTLTYDLFDYNSENLNLDSYNCETLKQAFLGSNGRRTGIYFGGLDDLDIYSPKFASNLTYEDSQGNVKTGAFEETVLFYEALEGDNLFEMSQYDVYLGEDKAYVKVTNENPEIDKKILIIKDSYSRPVIAFASTVYSEVVGLDVRYYNKDDFNGKSITDFILDYKPDMVIMMYNPYMLISDDNFVFD